MRFDDRAHEHHFSVQAAMTRSDTKKAPLAVLLSAEPKVNSTRNLLEHFDADLALGNFPQRGHTRLVLAFDLGCVTLAQHAGAVGRCEHELEAIRNLQQAIFDGDAGHEDLSVGERRDTESGNIERCEGVGTGSALSGITKPLRVNNGFKVKKRALKQLVDYNEVEFIRARHLFGRVL